MDTTEADKQGVKFFVTVGGENYPLTAHQLDIMDNEYLGFKFALVGLTSEQFLKWAESNGVLRCEAHNKEGAVCRHVLNDGKEHSPSEWLRLSTLRCEQHTPSIEWSLLPKHMR